MPQIFGSTLAVSIEQTAQFFQIVNGIKPAAIGLRRRAMTIRHDLAQSYLTSASEADAGDIEAKFGEMEAEARERLETEGVAAKDMLLQRAIDMMYEGQWRSLSVPVLSLIHI